MKKFIIILGLIVVTINIFSQDREVNKTLNIRQSYFKYVGTALDTVSNNADSLAIDFEIQKPYAYQYYIYLDIDTNTSSSTTIKLQGKIFDEESWTDISSVSFGGTADTTFAFNFTSEITKTISATSSVDTLINGTNPITVSLGTYAYLDTSTTDTIVTGWTYTPVLDTSYFTNSARTITETLTTNVKYWRFLRVLMIESGTGRTELQLIKMRIYERPN